MLHCLADLFVAHEPPEHVRFDNGPQFIADAVREWIAAVRWKTAYIAPGSPRESG